MAHLKVMGGLRLDPQGFTQPKPLLLLAYLALEGAQQRRRLAELFWRDGNRMKSLSMTLTRLRQGAGDVVASDEQRAWATSTSDAAELLQALDQGSWDRALSLYPGAFLDGIELADWRPELEEWVLGTREYLAGRVQHGLVELAEEAARANAFQRGATLADKAFRLPGAGPADPALLQRMYLLLVAGHHGGASEVGRELAGLGAPRVATAEEARAALLPAAPTHLGVDVRETPGARLASGPSHGAPLAGPLLGREAEVRTLEALLEREDAQLVTLLGPGGVGKSRLAQEIAARAASSGRYSGGAHLVALAAETRAERLPARVLETLGAAAGAGREPWDALAERVRDQRMLLVLDDVDGVRDALPELMRLLEDTATLTVLVTSRGRLGLPSEHAMVLEGLAYPSEPVGWDAAMAFGAVRLFVERAARARVGIDLRRDLPAIVALCRAVDGLPLALELAAPWTRVLACAEIVEQLASSPDILVTHERGAVDRHRSTRGVAEASWAFAGEAERAVLRKCTVFRGGFTRQAAAAVAGATLATLARLVDDSLLRVSGSGRFDLHPLLAAFFREKASEMPDEAAESATRHREHYLAWLAQQRALLQRERHAEVLTQLRRERGNVEAVLERALAERDLEAIQTWLELIDVTYEANGALREGAGMLARVQHELDGDVAAHRLLARVAIERGWYALRQGAYDAARGHTEDGMARTDPDDADSAALLARAETTLGIVAGASGNRSRAREHLERARTLAQRSGDEVVLASVLSSLGVHHGEAGEAARAIACFEEAIALQERHGRVLGTVRELGNLAIAVAATGDMARSGALMERSLALAREIDFRQTMPYTLSNLGVHYFRLGDLERARDLNLEALQVAEETGQRHIQVGILVNLVSVHARAGEVALGLERSDDALRRAQQMGLEPMMLQALGARAELEAARGRWGAAARLAQVVLQHPASRDYTRTAAAEVWQAVVAAATDRADASAALEDAIRDARAHDVATVTASVLVGRSWPGPS